MAEEIFVVQEQLLKAGAGDVDEAQFGLGRGAGGAAAFGDVLAAGARSLHHLVHSARPGIEELFTEPDRGVVDERGRLETAGIAVATTRSEFFHAAKGFKFGHITVFTFV